MFPTTVEQWSRVLTATGVRADRVATFAPAFLAEARPELFNLGEQELDDYLAEVLHETGNLRSLVEDLNYSAPRIRELGAMYPNGRWGLAAKQADYLAGKPEELAEVVYGNRMGNTRPGDGWLYRGQGIPMITGATNFARVGKLMGQDLLVNPQLLQQPRFAVEASVLWWRDSIPDSAIDHPDRVRKLVQGGELGLDDTRRKVAIVRRELEALS